MGPLAGEELFCYLGKLNQRVGEKKSFEQEGSLAYSLHSQMHDLLVAEQDFLIRVYGDKSVLSFSGNGMPSVESLAPDLEKMCQIDEPNFKGVVEGYRKGVKVEGLNEQYKEVSGDEWEKERKDYKKERLIFKQGFEISESDGKLELSLREEFYLNEPDEHSQKFPVLAREGRAKYQVAWGQLFSEIDEKCYSLNRALAVRVETLPAVRDGAIEKVSGLAKVVGGGFCHGLAVSSKTMVQTVPSFLAGFLTGHFMIPTSVRSIDDYEDSHKKRESNLVILSFVKGWNLGANGCIALGILPVMEYGFSSAIFGWTGLHTLLISIQLATNAVSGFYELGRWHYKKNKKQEAEEVK